MGKVIYSMSLSADGFIEDSDGDFNWTAPDEELFRFHTDRVRQLGAHLLGRRLYESMLYWEPADQGPALGPDEREFAEIWQRLPKVVFSTTLESVEGNARLARDSVAEEVRRLEEQVDGDLEVGGATLAADCIKLDLVDEYRLFVHPVIVGGGKSFFPSMDASLELELLETRSFAHGVVYLRYRRILSA
ncbi:MAG TPA: dihydrofolate reductase family protein [Solirubrobacterales bacterium]